MVENIPSLNSAERRKNEPRQHEENHSESNKESEERMSELSLIDITNDDELMNRVLKKSAEMQEETLKKAEEEE